jgi:hypothetical protein
MRRLAALVVLSSLFAIGESCADLPTLAAGTCGNGVVEAGEDCDGFPKDGCRAPGQTNECHFACTACPSGWGCDTKQDVCREPVGAFRAESLSTFEAPAARLSVGDFDGDGVTDLVAHSQADTQGQEYLRVFYFDRTSGSPAKTLNINAAAVTASAYNIDNDPERKSDLTFVTSHAGVNVLLGREDRTFGPIAFPRFPFPPGSSARFERVNNIDLGFKVPFFKAVPVIFAQLEPGKDVAVAMAAIGDPTQLQVGILPKPRTASDILDEPVAANIIDGVGNECEELIWAWKGEGAVQAMATCLPGNYPAKSMTRTPKVILTLPGDDKLRRPPLPVDLNGDGHVDLILHGTKAQYVAFGRGDGTFTGNPDNILLTAPPVVKLECDVLDPITGAPDPKGELECGPAVAGYAPQKKVRPSDQTLVVFSGYVLSVRSVASSSPTAARLTGYPVAVQTGAPWTVAVIDDFNANGLIDIAAASAYGSDVDFLNGTTSELFNPGRIRTDGPVRALTSGDYDGDLVNDLAIVEIDAGGKSIDAISVAYGRFAGTPEPALRLGVFPNVVQAKTAKAGGYDDTVQLGIIYRSEDTDLIAILDGRGDRNLLSPFGFAAPSGKDLIQALPDLVIPGRFEASEDRGAIVFGVDQDVPDPTDGPQPAGRLWFTPGKRGGRLGQPTFGDIIGDLRSESRSPEFHLVVANGRAANLNGDVMDEAVIVGPSTTNVPLLTVVSISGGKPVYSPPKPIANLPSKGVIGRINLELADIDGDGKIDAVIGVVAIGGVAAVIAWGDGNGGFDTNATTVIPGITNPLAFATLQLDTDPAKELIVASGEGTYTVQANGRTLTSTKVLPGATAVASGDFNGDGLPDIALSKEHRVTIYAGAPR